MHNYLTPDLARERKWVIAVYILELLGFVAGLTFVIAVLINYIREDRVRGTFLETHHRWQIRTFWYSLLWFVIGCITLPIVIGAAILAANFIWVIYRAVKGLLNVADNNAVFPYQHS